jgi:hypothetical protein
LKRGDRALRRSRESAFVHQLATQGELIRFDESPRRFGAVSRRLGQARQDQLLDGRRHIGDAPVNEPRRRFVHVGPHDRAGVLDRLEWHVASQQSIKKNADAEKIAAMIDLAAF